MHIFSFNYIYYYPSVDNPDNPDIPDNPHKYLYSFL